MSTAQSLAGTISKGRGGAWLVTTFDSTDDNENDEFSAASSHAKARRLCKEMAEEYGWERPFRWKVESGYLEYLYGTHEVDS